MDPNLFNLKQNDILKCMVIGLYRTSLNNLYKKMAESYINILNETIPEINMPIMRFTKRPVFPKISSVWMLFVCKHGKQKYFCKECGGKGIRWRWNLRTWKTEIL